VSRSRNPDAQRRALLPGPDLRVASTVAVANGLPVWRYFFVAALIAATASFWAWSSACVGVC
jgi:hypothetical protein